MSLNFRNTFRSSPPSPLFRHSFILHRPTASQCQQSRTLKRAMQFLLMSVIIFFSSLCSLTILLILLQSHLYPKNHQSRPFLDPNPHSNHAIARSNGARRPPGHQCSEDSNSHLHHLIGLSQSHNRASSLKFHHQTRPASAPILTGLDQTLPHSHLPYDQA